MMRGVLFSTGFFALFAFATLTGCNGSIAPAAPTPTPSPSNISGDYSGTMQDTQSGSGAATATLAQHGATAGGAIAAQLTKATLNAQISLTVTSSDAVSGAIVINYPNNGPTCTFSTTGNYNAATAVLSGSYTAVTNCTGDTGTYSLTQQCTDTVTSIERRRMTSNVTAC
ncbi:MAG: hypothetical protein WBD74_00865 [Candidatus Aquilonibacter sp.]